MAPRSALDWLLPAFVVVGGGALTYLALVVAPSFAGVFTAPLTSKLFYFHVPVAFASFLAFTVGLVHSLQYLRTRHMRSDRQAHSAIEVGVLMAGLTLATGMIWGEAEWGVPWRWQDGKLVVVLVMFLVYAAYLFLRSQLPEGEARGRIAGLYAVAAFASVPLAWFAHRIWTTFHPTVFGPETPDEGVVTPGVLPIFLFALLVHAALFLMLYRWRAHALALRARLDEAETAEAVP